MKIYYFFTLILTVLLLSRCTPKTSTALEVPANEPPATTMTETEKEELKEEIKKELEEEIRKELEAEIATKPPVEEEPTVTSAPSKPEKPALSAATAENMLQGAWKWERTTYNLRGQGNQINAPETIGYSKTAVFKAGRKVDILLNNFNAGTYFYTITDDGHGLLYINFSSPDNNTQHMEDGPLEIEQDAFKILGGASDKGGTIEFSRL